MAKTSGGLNKKSYQFSDQAMAAVRGVAKEKGISESAAARELVDLGFRVYQRRQLVQSPVEDLVIDSVAHEREVA